MDAMDVGKLYEQWLYALWTSGDPALAEALVSADFVGHWPERDVHGPSGVAAAIQRSMALFSQVTTSIEVGPIVSGDLVAARWSFRGAYRGGMPGVTVPVGTWVTLRGADVLRVDGGRFVEYWVSSDTEQLMAQLSPPESAER